MRLSLNAGVPSHSMTFQVGLLGNVGFVIASDTLAVAVGVGTMRQTANTRKI
jgi:hypothetical protein